jgi:hypothetical protein
MAEGGGTGAAWLRAALDGMAEIDLLAGLCERFNAAGCASSAR